MSIVLMRAVEYGFNDGDHVAIDGTEYTEAQLKAVLYEERVRVTFASMRTAVAARLAEDGCVNIKSEILRPPHSYFSVYPRYTVGSQAIVPRAMALRIAADEKDAYDFAMQDPLFNGYELATKKGLGGIVEEAWENNGKLWFRDVLTDERGQKQNKNGAR